MLNKYRMILLVVRVLVTNIINVNYTVVPGAPEIYNVSQPEGRTKLTSASKQSLQNVEQTQKAQETAATDIKTLADKLRNPST